MASTPWLFLVLTRQVASSWTMLGRVVGHGWPHDGFAWSLGDPGSYRAEGVWVHMGPTWSNFPNRRAFGCFWVIFVVTSHKPLINLTISHQLTQLWDIATKVAPVKLWAAEIPNFGSVMDPWMAQEQLTRLNCPWQILLMRFHVNLCVFPPTLFLCMLMSHLQFSSYRLPGPTTKGYQRMPKACTCTSHELRQGTSTAFCPTWSKH